MKALASSSTMNGTLPSFSTIYTKVLAKACSGVVLRPAKAVHGRRLAPVWERSEANQRRSISSRRRPAFFALVSTYAIHPQRRYSVQGRLYSGQGPSVAVVPIVVC